MPTTPERILGPQLGLPAKLVKRKALASKRAAAANAVLACPFIIPTLDSSIPLSLTKHAPGGDINGHDPVCHVARVGASLKGCPELNHLDMGHSILSAAMHAINRAIGLGKITCDSLVWPTESIAKSAETIPCYLELESADFGDDGHAGSAVVIQIGPLRVPRNRATHNLPCQIDAFEAAAPGFARVLYAVLNKVSHACIPIITPPMLLDHWFNLWDHESHVCDYEYVISQLELDDEIGNFAKQYKLKPGKQHAKWVSCFKERNGSFLPSDMTVAFGQSLDSADGRYSKDQPSLDLFTTSEISIVLQRTQVRDWCPLTGDIVHALVLLHKINLAIDAGARFAQGANDPREISHYPLFVCPNGQASLGHRIFDDITRDSNKIGGHDCLGYVFLTCKDDAQANTQLQQLQSGSQVVIDTIALLQNIGQM
jgi:hypothetical protein